MENAKEKRLKTKIPPFLKKVFEMVEDPNTNELISWGENNQSFIVLDKFEFSSILLPKYFKHNNFSSFVSKLHYYGFKKVHHTRIEYGNEWFMAGQRQLLCNIKKRIPQKKRGNEVKEIPILEPKKLRLLEAEIKYLRSENNRLKIENQEPRKNIELIAHKMANNKSKKETEIINLTEEKIVKTEANLVTNDVGREEPSEVELLNSSLNKNNLSN